jgi:hypothetical protein
VSPAGSTAQPDSQSNPGALADLDALAEQLRGRLVVQVQLDGDRFRTNCYRSASAAERAVKRARDRGVRVQVSLVQMVPVGVVVGLGDTG